MMADKKIIVVLGATGAQGGGLVRAILNDKNSEFAVRAVTRKADSDKAKELKEMGAEIIEGDVDDVESLIKAFSGAYGAYCVTFYWSHMKPEKELHEAINMADAAKRAGLKHVIWSTLEDTRKWVPLESNEMPTLMGKYKVPHFDAKGEADKYFLD
ncbi:MAG: NmrA family NAD(P)-binding protein, partial [Methanococcaceae archaeon]